MSSRRPASFPDGLVAALSVVMLVALAPVPAPALADEDDTSDNPWMERRDLTIGHRGATFYGPENTLYALRRGVDAGAQMLEFDLYASAEGEIVVIHDSTVDRTTDGSGDVGSMTVDELKELDAGYWHVDGAYATHDADEEEYLYRGIATGDVPPPPGFEANDFTIPTLEEVLEAFPDTWLLVEIKDFAPAQATGLEAAQRMAELLDEYGRSAQDGVVASFDDRWLEIMLQLAPQMSYAPGLTEAAATWASLQGPEPVAGDPRYDVLFLPDDFEGIEPIDPDTVENANEAGYAVHVFTVNDCHEMEEMLDAGVHGLVTDDPGLLEELFAWRGVRDDAAADTDPCEGADDRLAERAATPEEDDPEDDLEPTPSDDVAAPPLPATGGGATWAVALLVAGLALLALRSASGNARGEDRSGGRASPPRSGRGSVAGRSGEGRGDTQTEGERDEPDRDEGCADDG